MPQTFYSDGTPSREIDDDQPFQPDWRLPPPDALAVVLRLALLRRGVSFGDALATDEQWSEMCSEIIRDMGTGISPMRLVELPRAWDNQANEFPEIQRRVIVTLSDGREFQARRILVTGAAGEDCWAWAAADDGEPQVPACWDDGVCWAENADGVPSMPVVAWREIETQNI